MGKRDKSSVESKNKNSSDSSGSSDSSTDDEAKIRDKLKKMKKKLRKEERRAEKHLKKVLKKEKKKLKKDKKRRDKDKGSKHSSSAEDTKERSNEQSFDIPIGLMDKSKAMAPMTKEEWEKKRSVVRRVLDEESGRYRLIKGDGEVLEEIVSQKRHKEINKQATQADGDYFQSIVNK